MKRKAWKWSEIILLSGVFLLGVLPLSFAQEFPTKPINLSIGYSPGGTVDTSARLLAAKAEKFLGKPIVVLNKGGGAGSVALGVLAKEKPDGYNLVCVAAFSFVVVPQFRSVPYKYEDFIPVMHYGSPHNGLAVRSDSPWKTLKDLVEYARKNPGKFNYSVKGMGDPHHLAMEFIAQQENIELTAVPIDTSPITPLLGGHIGGYSGGTLWLPHVQSGALRLLVVYDEKRMKTFPEVPTLRELGYNFVLNDAFMLAAPKETPLPVVKKLDDAFRKAMDDPDFLRYMEKMEIEPSYRNFEDLKKFTDQMYVMYEKVVKKLKQP